MDLRLLGPSWNPDVVRVSSSTRWTGSGTVLRSAPGSWVADILDTNIIRYFHPHSTPLWAVLLAGVILWLEPLTGVV